MHPHDRQTKNNAAVRPRYIPLGTDGADAHHVYRPRDDTIHVIADGKRVWVEDVTDVALDAWMTYIAARRGWARRRYYDAWLAYVHATIAGGPA